MNSETKIKRLENRIKSLKKNENIEVKSFRRMNRYLIFILALLMSTNLYYIFKSDVYETILIKDNDYKIEQLEKVLNEEENEYKEVLLKMVGVTK